VLQRYETNPVLGNSRQEKGSQKQSPLI